ncbi:hypothetical protein KCU88_g314, partial [Aureobasidium melanogenum]
MVLLLGSAGTTTTEPYAPAKGTNQKGRRAYASRRLADHHLCYLEPAVPRRASIDAYPHHRATSLSFIFCFVRSSQITFSRVVDAISAVRMILDHKPTS